PIYFPSPVDVSRGNDAMVALQEREPGRVRGYVTVNPNHTDHALREMDRGVERGLVGLKLLASRRADDPLLDPLLARAADHGLPVLHHIWQHRTRHWPGQDISDGADLARLAGRHPTVPCILAHIGGGGDYAHTFAAAADVPNVYLDLSGSGVDRGMLDDALAAVGPDRLLWGADVTMETGLAKLWALEVIGLDDADMAGIRWRNAVGIFPPRAFPMLHQPEVAAR
ncbi:MAG: amidohydrolase family protein, partial [Gemmatimonadaceae bacterium]